MKKNPDYFSAGTTKNINKILYPLLISKHNWNVSYEPIMPFKL